MLGALYRGSDQGETRCLDGGGGTDFFNAPLLLLEDMKHNSQELRFHALGQTDDGRLLHITFTLRHAGEKIRVISARDMHRKERGIYEKAT